MSTLPLIVGIGGMNAAGRSSGFHSYKRMVHEKLSNAEMTSTWFDLAHRMDLNLKHGLTDALIEEIKQGTLIRQVETFDSDNVPTHIKGILPRDTEFVIRKNKLPSSIPVFWQLSEIDAQYVRVHIKKTAEVLLKAHSRCSVSCAGTIPKGFDPGKLYNSHHHPRGLSLAIYGASDALYSMGLPWAFLLKKHISPDEVSVYAGSALSQIDANSLAGLIGEPLRGNRINSKMMPLSLVEMPADFINSYVINSVGHTGTQVGACASFLYNLKQGIMDIQSKRAKVALIGNAEAPLVPEVMEGFSIMGALASDESLRALDGKNDFDKKRSCRPFATNTGFTMAEGAQFVVLMQDELALQLGLPIYGSVADVFIHADGNKKSISKPGVGNYLTFAKATALAQSILGPKDLERTFVQAHGTGTPQNRVTESHLLNHVAQVFNIKHWPVAAIKSYVGHTVGVAAGDQLMASLGVWRYGYIPGILTIDSLAHDVKCSNLNILMNHYAAGEEGRDYLAALINAKGFGGNNATGLVLSPHKTKEMLAKKYGAKAMHAYTNKNIEINNKIEEHDASVCAGNEKVFYNFGTSVMEEQDVHMTQKTLRLSQFEQQISLNQCNPYEDYT